MRLQLSAQSPLHRKILAEALPPLKTYAIGRQPGPINILCCTSSALYQHLSSTKPRKRAWMMGSRLIYICRLHPCSADNQLVYKGLRGCLRTLSNVIKTAFLHNSSSTGVIHAQLCLKRRVLHPLMWLMLTAHSIHTWRNPSESANRPSYLIVEDFLRAQY
jgi:hypothetical protein